MLSNWKKSKGFVLTALVCGALAVAGCGSEKEQAKTGTEVTWSQTFEGKQTEFAVKQAPTHAVSMSQFTTEMMLQLGLEDKMAGTAFQEEEIYPPLQEAYSKVKVLSDKWPSYEVFMSVKPDFATGWEDSFSKEGIPADKMIAQKVNIWIPESVLSTQADLETNFKDMIKLGEIFGVKAKAEEWVKGQRAILEKVQAKLKDLPHKRVFVYDSQDGQPFTVFEGYTTNVLRLIGADNVMSGLGVDKTWAKGSWETVVQQNPDYIIIPDYGNSIRNDDDFQEKVAKIKADPQLQTIKAVQENHFVRVKLSEITPGVRTVEALKRLAEEIHGIHID